MLKYRISAAAGIAAAFAALVIAFAPHAQAQDQVPAPCSSQGSCTYCGQGGIGTGTCTKSDLEWNVGWCTRNRSTLSAYNRTKCNTEAAWLHSWGGFSWGHLSGCVIPAIGAIASVVGGYYVIYEVGSVAYYATVTAGGASAYGLWTC
jgi:hypothetical protein